jgi:hypothetical protein
MPERATARRAAAAKRRGAKAFTQAGAYVGEEMRHRHSQKHGRMTQKQAIAIGLSKARKAGVRIPRKSRSETR